MKITKSEYSALSNDRCYFKDNIKVGDIIKLKGTPPKLFREFEVPILITGLTKTEIVGVYHHPIVDNNLNVKKFHYNATTFHNSSYEVELIYRNE